VSLWPGGLVIRRPPLFSEGASRPCGGVVLVAEDDEVGWVVGAALGERLDVVDLEADASVAAFDLAAVAGADERGCSDGLACVAGHSGGGAAARAVVLAFGQRGRAAKAGALSHSVAMA
jgi:hypothetical protein